MIEPLAVVVPLGPNDRATGLLRQLGGLLPGASLVVSATRPALPEETAAAAGLRLEWIAGPGGRAGQQNRGASAATGSWLWFLHADSSLNPDTIGALEEFTRAADSAASIGYFRLAFSDDGPGVTRLNAALANARSRWLALPFGDQGFVVPPAVWSRLGGFDDSLGRGEDLDLVVRARAAGIPLKELPAVLTTSARRYRTAGWLRTTWRHLWLTVSLYRSARRRLSS